jgi:hypothetical protein
MRDPNQAGVQAGDFHETGLTSSIKVQKPSANVGWM